MSCHGVYTTRTLHPTYRQRWRGVDMVYTRHGHCPLRTDRQTDRHRWRGVDVLYTRHGHCPLRTDRQTDTDGEELMCCIHDMDIVR